VDGHPFRDAQHRLARTRIAVTPRTGSVGALVVLAIWNVMFGSMVVAAWKHDHLLWGAIALLCLVMGVGGFVYGLHETLAMRNATVELYVSEPEPAIGETLDIRWEVKGRAQRIRELAIAITGSEVATSTRSSDDTSSTETSVFFREQLAVVRDPREIAAGSAQITLRDTVPSWEAPNNKIVWSIEVTGDIRHWPDIADHYDIRVVGSAAERRKAA